MSRFVASLSEEWKASSDPRERRYAPGAAQLARTLLVRCKVIPDYLGAIGVGPLQSNSFDYLFNDSKALPDLLVTLNGTFIDSILEMTSSSWAQRPVARSLLKSLVIKELATAGFYSEYRYIGRSEALLSRMLRAKSIEHGGAIKAADLSGDRELVELVKIFSSYLARGEAEGYAEQVRYLSIWAVPIAAIRDLGAFPGLDPVFKPVFAAWARNFSAVDPKGDDLVWDVAMTHVQILLDEPGRTQQQLSKQYVAFGLAGLIEILDGRASLVDGRIHFNVDPRTGKPSREVMKGIRDPKVFAPRPEYLTRHFGPLLALMKQRGEPGVLEPASDLGFP